AEKVIEFLMGPIYDMNGNLRIKPGKFCHCLMKLLAAIAPQISNLELQLLILPYAESFSADILYFIQDPLTLLIKIFSRRSKGKASVFSVYQLYSQFLLQ